jgi:hypothetical protein
VRKLGQSVIARIGSGKQDQRSLSSGSAKAEASEKGFHLLVTWWPPCAKIFKEHRKKKPMVISSCANSISLSLSLSGVTVRMPILSADLFESIPRAVNKNAGKMLSILNRVAFPGATMPQFELFGLCTRRLRHSIFF